MKALSRFCSTDLITPVFEQSKLKCVESPQNSQFGEKKLKYLNTGAITDRQRCRD